MAKHTLKIGKPVKDLVIKGSTTHMGGTRQTRKTVNVKDSKSAKQVNPGLVERLDKAGLSLSATDETGKRMEHVDDLKIPMNEAVKTKQAFINMIVSCMIMLALISGIKSVSSDMAAKISTKYNSSSSPRSDAFTDGQRNSLVSYPMRIAVSPRKVDHHQVFFNFRGEQLRYNFVSHLSDAFQRHEINFFIDNYEQRGKDLKHLFVRIQESTIALAIFSPRYTESSWCLDELVKMKKLADQGKLRVIPIFYKVDAEDVRKPTSCSEFGKNFWRLAESSSGDQIKQWKEALAYICDKMGLSYGDKCSESDFVKEIVKEVQRVIESIGLQEKAKPFLRLRRLHR